MDEDPGLVTEIKRYSPAAAPAVIFDTKIDKRETRNSEITTVTYFLGRPLKGYPFNFVDIRHVREVLHLRYNERMQK